MKRRVVVTGIGVVTSLGCRVDELWQNILSGRSGVHELTVFDTDGHKVKFGGDIGDAYIVGFWRLCQQIGPARWIQILQLPNVHLSSFS